MGETTMRLGRWRLRRVKGENSWLMMGPMGGVDRSDYQSTVFVAGSSLDNKINIAYPIHGMDFVHRRHHDSDDFSDRLCK